MAGPARASWTREQISVVVASYLGWALDAFDFFLMVFLFEDIATEFATTVPVVAWAVTLTLAARFIGAWEADAAEAQQISGAPCAACNRHVHRDRVGRGASAGVGELDADVEALGILERRPIQQQVGPLVGRRQPVAGEGVDVGAGPEMRALVHDPLRPHRRRTGRRAR